MTNTLPDRLREYAQWARGIDSAPERMIVDLLRAACIFEAVEMHADLIKSAISNN